MNAFEGLARGGTFGRGVAGAPAIVETHRGYVIAPPARMRARAGLIEVIATFAGAILVCTGLGQWFLPGSDLSAGVLPLKLGASGLFLAVGVALLRAGLVGLVQETQVDRFRGEVRLVRRNRSGSGREVGRLPFTAVTSVVLHRSKTPFTPAVLCLRRADGGGFVELVAADEGALLPIRDRLIADMSPRFRAAPVAPRIRPRRVEALA